MWFGEPHPFPKRGSPTRLSVSGQQSYEGWSCRVRNSALRDLPLIKLTVAGCLGTMGFLITYSPGTLKKHISNKRSAVIIFNTTLFL